RLGDTAPAGSTARRETGQAQRETGQAQREAGRGAGKASGSSKPNRPSTPTPAGAMAAAFAKLKQ
ncbi:MAG: hypothetical protein ACYC5S_11315, partial [Thiobacillus sp.]